MLLILEGIEGTGKTTLAKAIERDLMFIRYRPFTWEGPRLTSDELAAWSQLGIQANTYVEDIYAADMLAALSRRHPVRVVLDRSLPSGIVYSSLSDDQAIKLMEKWSLLVKAASGIIIHLTGDVSVLRERALVTRAQDQSQRTIELMESRQRRLVDIMSVLSENVPKFTIDASKESADNVYSRVRLLCHQAWGL